MCGNITVLPRTVLKIWPEYKIRIWAKFACEMSISIPKMCINRKFFSFRRSVQPKKNSNDDIIINEKPVEPDDIEIQ